MNLSRKRTRHAFIANLFVFLTFCDAQIMKMGQEILTRDELRAILNLVHRPVGKPGRKEICYGNLGCFNTDKGAMKHLGLLPQSPNFIRTKFFLYSREHPTDPIAFLPGDHGTLVDHLNVTLRVVVLIHGWGYEVHSDIYDKIKDAFLEKVNVNVIFVKWSRGSMIKDYLMSVINTELVGRQVGNLLWQMKILGVSEKRMHLVGFSLGAHVAGFAGKWTIMTRGFRIGRISALDPAGFLFEHEGQETHVSKGDADFVDVLHTGGGNFLDTASLGMMKSVGDVDFYPNGGFVQPGCVGPICSHIRAAYLYIETIKDNCEFLARPCRSRFRFLQGLCPPCPSLKSCGRMGFYSITTFGRGKLYLETSSKSPYCLKKNV